MEKQQVWRYIDYSCDMFYNYTMSTSPLLKVDDTHVQQRLKEVLGQVDALQPNLGDHEFLSRTSANGCEERMRFGDTVYPQLILSELRSGQITDGRMSGVKFDFFVHNEDGSSCNAHQSIASAELVTVTVAPHEDGSWTSVTDTTIVRLSRMYSSGDQSNNALSAVRSRTVKTEVHGQNHRVTSTTTETSSHALLETLEELDEVLAAFMVFARANLTI